MRLLILYYLLSLLKPDPLTLTQFWTTETTKMIVFAKTDYKQNLSGSRLILTLWNMEKLIT